MLGKRNRLWVAAGAMAVATSVGLGTVWSYVRTGHAELGRQIRDAVPIAFELKRLAQMTDDLIPELRANQKVAAQLDVEIEYLQREIDSMNKAQAEARTQMQKLRAALEGNGPSHEFGGRTFTRQEVEADLDRRLEEYDNAAVQLVAKERILQDRKRTLTAASDKIREYERQQELLVQRSESLNAEVKLVELAQQTGNIAFDHSKLSRAKELAESVEKRIRTLQKFLEQQRQVAGEIPVEADVRPIAQRFDEYFADQPAKAKSQAEADTAAVTRESVKHGMRNRCR
jgi:prefoldin subunit 5